jgi:hypothetical protein
VLVALLEVRSVREQLDQGKADGLPPRVARHEEEPALQREAQLLERGVAAVGVGDQAGREQGQRRPLDRLELREILAAREVDRVAARHQPPQSACASASPNSCAASCEPESVRPARSAPIGWTSASSSSATT